MHHNSNNLLPYNHHSIRNRNLIEPEIVSMMEVPAQKNFLETIATIDNYILDNFSFFRSNGVSYGGLKSYIIGLNASCHCIIWTLLPLMFFFMFPNHKLQEFFINLWIVVMVDLITTYALRMTFRRPKPYFNYPYIIIDKYTLPCGYISRAVVLSGFLRSCVNNQGLAQDLLRVWTTLIGLSRLLLGRNYLSDIIVGAFWGMLQSRMWYYSGFWLSLNAYKIPIDKNIVTTTFAPPISVAEFTNVMDVTEDVDIY